MHRPTSQDSPIRIPTAFTHPSGGRVGLTFAPGKRDANWNRDLATDLDRMVSVERVDWLVSLVEDFKLRELQIAHLVEEARARNLVVERFPIPDYSIPEDPRAAWDLVHRAADAVRAGRHVVFHCWGGKGRAGTMAACTLVSLGVPPDEAIARVRAVRPGAIETRDQESFVRTPR